MSIRWIVTPSRPQAAQQVLQLRRCGLDAMAIPCVELAWLGWPDLAVQVATQPSALFVTSGTVAARIDPPAAVLIAALAPVTQRLLAARRIAVSLSVRGGASQLARVVCRSPVFNETQAILYPASDLAQRQPEHRAAVLTLAARFNVQVRTAYETRMPRHLAASLARAAAQRTDTLLGPGFVFWSPSAIQHFVAAGGLELIPRAIGVFVGASTARAWQELAAGSGWICHAHDRGHSLDRTLRRAQLRYHKRLLA